MKKILLFSLFLFSTAIFSQDLSLNGIVLEKDTNFPLPGATVEIIGKEVGVVTDFDGNFEIIISVGDKIKVSYIGKKLLR